MFQRINDCYEETITFVNTLHEGREFEIFTALEGKNKEKNSTLTFPTSIDCFQIIYQNSYPRS